MAAAVVINRRFSRRTLNLACADMKLPYKCKPPGRPVGTQIFQNDSDKFCENSQNVSTTHFTAGAKVTLFHP
jgi:hypothetical protein